MLPIVEPVEWIRRSGGVLLLLFSFFFPDDIVKQNIPRKRKTK